MWYRWCGTRCSWTTNCGRIPSGCGRVTRIGCRAQAAAGRAFTAEQRWWLDQIVETMGVNVSVSEDDLTTGEFFNRGGLVKARQVFGAELPALLDELNVALA